MPNRLPLLLLLLALVCGPALAQQAGTIEGRVLDADTQEPLPGANVVVLDTQTGTITNADGYFTLPAIQARQAPYQIRASFAGYTGVTREARVTQPGQVVNLNFSLRSGVELEGIVVTALGIERQERELGYSVSQIRGDEVTTGDNTNLVQALSGRIAGLDIVQSSGNVGASSRIVIRGITSLSGENQPLFVVDGVPISNANVASMQFGGSGGTQRFVGAPDTGNRANDINPADIESVSVLRGGAAAALYGSRAANGVILITTRRGLDRPRAQVQVSSSMLTSTIGRMPSYQNEYAGGTVGAYEMSGTWAVTGWGPRIAGQEVRGTLINPGTPENPALTTLTAYPDNVRDFYQTGRSFTNNVAFSTGTATSDFRFAVGRIGQEGVIPGSELTRTTLSVNAGTRLASQFTARVSANFVTSEDLGRIAQGANTDPNMVQQSLRRLPRTMHISELRDYKLPDGGQRPFVGFSNNPYWVIFENVFTSDVQRVYGHGTVGFSPLEWLSLTARAGTDFYTQNRRQLYAPGTVGRDLGAYIDDVLQERELNFDLLANVDRPISDEFSFRAVVGSNVNQRDFQRNAVVAENYVIPDVHHPGNMGTTEPRAENSLQRLFGFFGDVTFGWRDAVFLNLTGRNDYSSTLPVDNRSYFYPSAALSVVITDLVDVNPNVLSYGKLRTNVARVGSDEAPYQINFQFFPVGTSDMWAQFGSQPNLPYLGELNPYRMPFTLPPFDLRPQMQTTYELGTELGFLQDRISLDLTAYSQRTTDQIISIPTPRSTGFTWQRTNIGEVTNRGIEATLNAQTLDIGPFSHSFRTTFSTNQNRIVELAPGVDYLAINAGFSQFDVGAEPGMSLGLYGLGWLRDVDVFDGDGNLVRRGTGEVLIDPNTGLRITNTTEQIRLGDLDPRFRMGFTNTFRYGPVSLSALIDWRSGGSIYSETANDLPWWGLSEETLVGREGTFVDRGVIVTRRDADNNVAEVRPNDVPVISMLNFWQAHNHNNLHEAAVFDATFVKLREVVLTLDLPRTLLQRTPFGTASLAIEGRNLALLYSRVPHIDPEVNTFGPGTIAGGGYEFNSIPATRNFGVNLSLTF